MEDARQAARHIPLRKRAKEPTVEERLARYGKAPVSLTEYGTQPGRLEDSSSLQQALKLRQLT